MTIKKQGRDDPAFRKIYLENTLTIKEGVIF
jgi:hypothetical protein